MKRVHSLHAFGAFMTVGVVTLTIFSHFIDPTAKRDEVIALLSLLLLLSGAYGFAAYGLTQGRGTGRLRAVVVWAVIFRIALLPSKPILETDYYRYLWDGFVLAHGINPYRYTPLEILSPKNDSVLDASDREDRERLRSLLRTHLQAREVLENVNHPEIKTVYPPGAQILFGISAVFFPLSLWGWRLVILLFDAALMQCLILLLSRWGRDPTCVLFYAWSPLVLKEYINTLHFDGIALSLFFLGILLTVSNVRKRAAPALAGAIQIKLFPLLLLPAWSRRLTLRGGLWIGVWVMLFLLPFLSVGKAGLSGLALFSYQWESNSSLTALFEWFYQTLGFPPWGEGPVWFSLAGVPVTGDAFLWAKLSAVGLFLLIFIYLSFFKSAGENRTEEQSLYLSFLVLGALLICGPIGNPWYIAWITPFLCFFPRLSWIYLCVSCFVYYTFFLSDPWGYPAWSRPLEYLPFYGLLLWEWRRPSPDASQKP